MEENALPVTGEISINWDEIHLDYTRASGPGGQNINKVSTAVELRFDVRSSTALPEDVRQRLFLLAGRRINDQGVLIIQARRFRTQERNRQDAVERLVQLVRQAAQRPRQRHKTLPTLASQRRRVESKLRLSKIKQLRRIKPSLDD